MFGRSEDGGLPVYIGPYEECDAGTWVGIGEFKSVVSITATFSSGRKRTIGSNVSRVGLLIFLSKCDKKEDEISSETLYVGEEGSVSVALKNPRHPFY